MKLTLKMITLTIVVTLSTIGAQAFASEFQSISGEEAYKLFESLPGAKCVEWRQKDQIVYSKSQTKTCSEQQLDDSKWSCVAQLSLKGKVVTGVLSADCTRSLK